MFAWRVKVTGHQGVLHWHTISVITCGYRSSDQERKQEQDVQEVSNSIVAFHVLLIIIFVSFNILSCILSQYVHAPFCTTYSLRF